MPNSLLPADSLAFFRSAEPLYPHPIAVACGNILRSRSPESLVDGVVKASEVLARYLAVVGIASYATREGDNDGLPISPNDFSGPIAFGTFLECARGLSTCKASHALKTQLAAGLAPKGKGKQKQEGPTYQALSRILGLRNDLGHELASLTTARAKSILSKDEPVRTLQKALEGVSGLLSLPLFVVEEQKIEGGQIEARCLVLMGASSDPEPEQMVLGNALESNGVPYLGLKNSVLRLDPLLVWDINQDTANYRLYIVDKITEATVLYKAVQSATYEKGRDLADRVQACLEGTKTQVESLKLKNGQGISQWWRAKRSKIESQLPSEDRKVPWELLEEEILGWYTSRLDTDEKESDPKKLIQMHLLDGRDELERRELDQLVLLFGTEGAVGDLLRRELLDLRAVKSVGERWDERIESHANIARCLRQAVDFVTRHIGLGEVTVDGLKETSGTADYIAMREALVNLFIHQDYSDSSAAAQVELQPERAQFFNPGHSLVSDQALIEGGKSQARNPLVARALRRIGFAELAGSGLREVQRAWRGERRRPPNPESDRDSNTFTLILDWREIPDYHDQVWKDRIGAHLTEDQATILNLALASDGIDERAAAAATDLTVEDAEKAIRHLVRQALLEASDERYRVREHLKELVE